ncbi:MAG: GNAT family N-acetyltransferase [Bacteroidota bacterium]
MVELIPKVERQLLREELNEKRFVRFTHFGSKEIYIIDANNAPNVLREIGRLRELSFRAAGGGTGKSLDIDAYDEGENPFQQLLVWSPEDEEIVGGYRFIHCAKLAFDEQGKVKTPTSKLFHYSPQFIREYLPYTIELGRSFVQPDYQPARNVRKGIYSLDNLWDGLGAIVLQSPDVKYFFGKITMYPHTDQLAREAIMYFLHKYFSDPDNLVYPYSPVKFKLDPHQLESIFKGENYEEDFKILQQFVRKRKENIPPLVNAYMNLSSTMRMFGTSVNKNFGNVEESGIMITISDIYDDKKDRHISNIRK